MSMFRDDFFTKLEECTKVWLQIDSIDSFIWQNTGERSFSVLWRRIHLFDDQCLHSGLPQGPSARSKANNQVDDK